MRLVAASDTHNRLHQIMDKFPEGDLLIHCGDLTGRGEHGEITRQLRALGELKSRYTHGVVFCVGNHDFLFQKQPMIAREIAGNNGLIYLEHESTEIAGLKIFASPYTPTFFNWAFMKDRGVQIRRYWDQIPQDTDVLVTHGPPMGWLDSVEKVHTFINLDGEPKEWVEVEHVGCEELTKAVERVKPRVMAFGHIHSGYGKAIHPQGTIMVNASLLGEDYKFKNLPIIIDL